MKTRFPLFRFDRRFRMWGMLAVLLSFGGCFSPQQIHVGDTDPQGWSREEPVCVAFDNDDTLRAHNLYLITRFERSYAYDRFGVVVATTTPEGFIWRDTLFVKTGVRPFAQALYSDNRQLWRTETTFPQQGRYLFTFTPLLPDPVRGVAAVGVEIQ